MLQIWYKTNALIFFFILMLQLGQPNRKIKIGKTEDYLNNLKLQIRFTKNWNNKYER
jgi:hypothetical protein